MVNIGLKRGQFWVIRVLLAEELILKLLRSNLITRYICANITFSGVHVLFCFVLFCLFVFFHDVYFVDLSSMSKQCLNSKLELSKILLLNSIVKWLVGSAIILNICGMRPSVFERLELSMVEWFHLNGNKQTLPKNRELVTTLWIY